MAKYETHESYALIGISRQTSNKNHNLFGSSVSHQNTIRIGIRRAEMDRHLNRNWYFGRELLCEVEMSQTQFAEMITTPNVGNGVPCTLRSFNSNDDIQDPPIKNQRQIFEEEFQSDINKVKMGFKIDLEKIEHLLKKKSTLSVRDKKEILEKINSMYMTITDSIPFIQTSFNEAMDKTVTEAKGEVEAFVMNKITSLGLEAIKNKPVELLEDIVDANYSES